MPDSHLKIVIDLNPGQASSLLGQLQKDLKATGAATDATAENNKRAGMSFTELNSAISLGRRGLQALQGVYDATIEPTIKYADEVRNLSREIGSTAEESSKLIQAADDVFISSETLTAGLQAAIRKGVQPTIQGIGELSDQYLKLAPGVQRTKFLMDNFGRSGADLGALMEKGAAGINAMGAAADRAGQVLSGEDLQATLEYKQAIDALQDSWQGLVIGFTRNALPTLIAVAKAEEDQIDVHHRYDAAVKAGIISTQDQTRIMFADLLGHHAEGLAILEAAEAVDRHTKAVDAHAEALNAEVKQTTVATTNTQYWTGEMWKAVDGANAVAEAGAQQAIKLQQAADMAQWLADRTDEATIANDRLAASQRSWLDSEAGDVIGALQNAGLSASAYALAEGAIDQAYGTEFANQDAHQAKIKAIIDQYKRTGDVDAFYASMNALAHGPMVDAAKAAQDAWKASGSFIATMNSAPASLGPAAIAFDGVADAARRAGDAINDIPKETSISIVTSYTSTGAPEHRRALGGPVSLGVPYIVGERGPEMFMPAQSGTIIPNDALSNAQANRLTRAGDTIIINDRLAVGLYLERKRQHALTYNDALM